MTKTRAGLVYETTLFHIANDLNLGEYLVLGRGEENSGGRNKTSILADAVEAVIAAIYLDRGVEEANKFILEKFTDIIEKAIKNKIILDFKTKLQEFLQINGEVDIRYDLLKYEGPPHHRKFYISVFVADKEMGKGLGYSKKEAEQNAAKEALIDLEVIDE